MANSKSPTDQEKLEMYENLLHLIGILGVNADLKIEDIDPSSSLYRMLIEHQEENPIVSPGEESEIVIGRLVLNIIRWHHAESSEWSNSKERAEAFWNLLNLNIQH